MDYFNDITNEEFIKDFITELYSVMNFVHEEEDEEDDFLLPDRVYGKHIMATQDKLIDRLYKLVKEHNLPNEEIEKIVDLKRRELFAVLLPMIDEYELKIKVDYGH
jgi:hypothetical protein